MRSRRICWNAAVRALVVAAVLVEVCAGASRAWAQEGVTYAADVAQVLNTHCVVCHRSGAIGPFSLSTYESARIRAEQIAEVTAARRMPPWKPVEGHGRFQNERRLSADDIAMLGQWAAAGAPSGDLARTPAAPAIGAWQLGEPDLVVQPEAAFTLAAGTDDVYRNFVLPVNSPARRWVRAVELNPESAGQVVHHARIMLDATGDAAWFDDESPEPGYDGLMLDHARFPSGHFLGWAPGKTVTELSADITWPLEPGTDLVVQLHLLPEAVDVEVRPLVGLYFSDEPATRTPISLLMTSKVIRIPPNEASHVVADRYRLPVAVDVLGITPHMHFLGKRVVAVAEEPDGTEVRLLRIDDWDFNWQDEYRYLEPVRLPAGTRISVEFTFDNSTANPRNPHDPPVGVGFGPRASDEMAELMLQLLPVGDANELKQSLSLKQVRDDILGYQSLLSVDPTDHVSQAALAVRYLDVGEIALARQHLTEALSAAPDFADAHFNLGIVLLNEGDVVGAIASYRRAVEFQPAYPEAHNNLGALLGATGAVDEAMGHYRQALLYDSQHSGAHYNLANLLLQRRATDDAISHFRQALAAEPTDTDVLNALARVLVGEGAASEAVPLFTRAVELNPELAPPLLGLAWVRATAADEMLRNAVEAVALAERAEEIVGQDHPEVLDTLAAAYAAAGEFENAVETAGRALVAARQTPDFADLVAVIESRMRLYLRFRPYRAEF